MTLIVPTVTDAMTIDRATVRVNPTRTDTVRLAGSLPGLSLDGVESIRLALDGVGFEVPVAAFTRKRQQLRYRATGDEPGISSMRIDLRSGRFVVALKPLALGTIESPVTVGISAGEASACTRLRLVDRKAKARKRNGPPRPRRLVLAPKKGLGTGCAIATPEFDPPALLVGDPPTVTVAVSVAGSVTDGSALLRAADATGAPTGDALCTLLDDGEASHGDVTAGDGRFSCVLTLDTSAPSRLRVLATATIAEATEASPVGELPVSGPITSEEFAGILGVQRRAGETCRAMLAEHGDTLRARLETVAALRTDPSIVGIRLAEESGAITITHGSGIAGSTCGGCREVEAPVAGAQRGRIRPSVARASGDEDAQLISSRKVFIWEPDFPEILPEGAEVRDLFERSTCPRFEVTYLQGKAASYAALGGISGAGTIVIPSHGEQFRMDRVLPFNCVRTGTYFSDDTDQDVIEELQRRGLVLDTNVINSANVHSCVTPWGLRRLGARAADAFMWGGFCHSGFHQSTVGAHSVPDPSRGQVVSLVEAFAASGVHTHFGWTKKISGKVVHDLAVEEVFPKLISQFKTTAEVFDEVDPKEYPHNKTVTIRFVAYPGPEPALVYLKAKITPSDPALQPSQQAQLTATVEGADDCTLQYHWRNTGVAGHLIGGDDVTTSSKEVTYEAGQVAGDLQDIVTVEVIDLGGEEPRTLLTRNVTVRVSPSCIRCSDVTNADTCTPHENCCQDGEDNDSDGPVDCDDPDCDDDPACQTTTTTSTSTTTTAPDTGCGPGVTPLNIRGVQCCPSGSGNFYVCPPWKCHHYLFGGGPGGCDLWCNPVTESAYCGPDVDGFPTPGGGPQECCCTTAGGGPCLHP